MRKPIYKVEKYNNLKEMLIKTGEQFANNSAYRFKTEIPGKFEEITHKEFRDEINKLGTALIEMGLKNKRIAVISENRYEWGVAYLAIVTGTGVVVPLDKALPDNEIESLIIRSEVEAIFYSNKYDNIMKEIKNKNNTQVKYFISMDLDRKTDDIYSQNELIKKGEELIKNGNTDFLNAKIDSEKMGIMLFTSGTTAMSKAVMLSHKNICTNLFDIASTIKIDETNVLLSFLPLHHTFECTVGFLYPISKGSTIVFCEGIRHIANNIKEFEANTMISVPVLYEAMYKRIMKQIEKKGKMEDVQKGIKISRFFLKFGIDIRKKVFKEIHESLGDIKLFVAGGAALDAEVEKGYNELGFKMYQGYGLTETSPVIAAEDDKYRKVGSIGKAFPSLDVKIEQPNEDGIGELLVKGDSVMLGYYNNEEATKEAIDDDGWLHTGDLAKIDEKGYIFISGRKKFVIVLKNGKNIYPEELEALINKIDVVKESFVYGKPEEDGDYKICAKIVYDMDIAKNIYETKNEDELKELIWREIKQVNKTMPAYKYIREITITDKDLIKTTTQKIKRFEEIKTVV